MSYRVRYGNCPATTPKSAVFDSIEDAELFAEGIIAGFNLISPSSPPDKLPKLLFLEENTGWTKVKSWTS